jgi:hypothetical protein
MTVPQVGHLPLMALRPFFMVSSTPSAISFLALHLTQYPSGIEIFRRPTHHAPGGYGRRMAGRGGGVNGKGCSAHGLNPADGRQKTQKRLRRGQKEPIQRKGLKFKWFEATFSPSEAASQDLGGHPKLGKRPAKTAMTI